MKKVLIILGVALVVASTAFAQSTSVVDTKHNLTKLGGADAKYGGQVCVYCHTPHRASEEIGALWNKAMPGMPTRNGEELEYVNPASSLTCLACHDGTIGVDSVLNLGGMAAEWPDGGATGYTFTWEMAPTNPAYIGSDLSNDHPIGEAYPTIAPATSTRWKSATPSTSGTSASVTVTTGGSLRMPVKEGVAGVYTVECATCHTPHSNANGYFLRAKNTGSALCLACHTR